MITKRILCFLSLLCVLARCYSLADERTSTAGELIADYDEQQKDDNMLAGVSVVNSDHLSADIDELDITDDNASPLKRILRKKRRNKKRRKRRNKRKYKYGAKKGDLCGLKKRRCRSNRRRSCIKYGPIRCGRGLTCRVDKYYYGKSYRHGYQNMYCVRRRKYKYGSRKGGLCGFKKKRCRSNRRRSCIKYGPRPCGRGLTCRVGKHYYGKSYRRGYQNMYCVRRRRHYYGTGGTGHTGAYGYRLSNFTTTPRPTPRPTTRPTTRPTQPPRRKYKYGSRKGDLCGFKKKRCRSNRRRSCIKYGPRACGRGLTCRVDKYYYGKSYRRGYQNMYCVRRRRHYYGTGGTGHTGAYGY